MSEGRYDRQLGLPELKDGGQNKLAAARITVVGAGGLGSSLLFSLVGAGVRRLRIIDNDIVSMSNLNRQFLYTPADIGLDKAARAAKRLIEYEPELELKVVSTALDNANSIELLQGCDLVISCVDSISVRYMINEACCRLGITYIDGAVRGFYGYISYVVPGKSACFVCQNGPLSNRILATADSTRTNQVIGTIPTIIGAMQAQMVIDLILDCCDAEPGARYYYNGKEQSIEKVTHVRDPNCSFCGNTNSKEDGEVGIW